MPFDGFATEVTSSASNSVKELYMGAHITEAGLDRNILQLTPTKSLTAGESTGVVIVAGAAADAAAATVELELLTFGSPVDYDRHRRLMCQQLYGGAPRY